MRELLYQMKQYIENTVMTFDSEWGYGWELPELIEKGKMPDIYHEVLEAIKKLEEL